MRFEQAFKAMKHGAKVKLPSWGGYWYWDPEKETIMMHCRPQDVDKGQGPVLDIRETQRVEYTLQNILSDDWQVADTENCPVLGGEAMFSFGDAIKYLKRGMKVTKKSWHKAGMYLELQEPDAHSKMTAPYIYITIDSDYRIPWHPSQADALEEDWIFAE